MRRLREGRHLEIAGLTGEALDWLGSYHPSDIARLGTLAPTLPPRRTARRAHFLDREDRRSRAMAALLELSTRRDYPDLVDADVARAAKISTEAFHRQFPSKHDCLLAILDELAAELHDAIQRATRSDEDWARAICKGVQALLGYCAAHPDLMRLALVDVLDAREVKRAGGLLDGFAKTMTDRIPTPIAPPTSPPKRPSAPPGQSSQATPTLTGSSACPASPPGSATSSSRLTPGPRAPSKRSKPPRKPDAAGLRPARSGKRRGLGRQASSYGIRSSNNDLIFQTPR